jgi:hypothetical protein
LQPAQPVAAWETVTEAQMAAISYVDLPEDAGIITPLAGPFDRNPDAAQRAGAFAAKLKSWPQAHLGDAGQSVRNLLCVASIADLSQDPLEGEIARVVFNQLEKSFEPGQLRRILTWVTLNPADGSSIMNAPELGFRRHPPEWAIRNRNELYARKFLGRLLGKIRD